MSTITMSSTDPGEGSALANDNYLAVYGGSSLLDIFYPVGCYFETSDGNFDPNTAWGGAWEQDTGGRVLVAQDNNTFATLGDTGGEETHTLTVAEMPAHRHDMSGGWGSGPQDNSRFRIDTNSPSNSWDPVKSTGGDGAHNNLQPYIVIKRWHRIA